MEIKDTAHLEQLVTDLFQAAKTDLESKIEALKLKGISTPELETKVAAMIRRIDELDVMRARPGAGSVEVPKTVGQMFAESEQFKGFMARGWHRGGAAMKLEDINPHGYTKGSSGFLESKTTIDSAAVGSSTPGILNAQRVGGIIPLAERRLTMRDLIPNLTTTLSAVDYVRENVFTNAASPQAESSSKVESADTFVIASATVRTIAHWIPASRQVLDDFGQLAAFIDHKLMYGLKLKEETEIIAGDNLGNHLNGITTQASAYAGTYDVGGDTKLDRLRRAIMELEASDNYVDGIVLNPVDYGRIELIKTDVGGANTGTYIVGDPSGSGLVRIPTLWGRPVVLSNSLTVGKFLMGAFGQFSAIYDRMAAVIDVSTEHSDYYIKNLVAIRCEERMCLAVYRATAFMYGNLP